MKKSFNEKLKDTKDMPKIVAVEEPGSVQRYGGTMMLIAPPKDYDDIIKTIPHGKLMQTELIRKTLADKYGAQFTCPLTAGIFINICAHAHEERGGLNPTPYWRVVKKDGELNEKFPGGLEKQKAALENEGHEITIKGKRLFVKDYQTSLI